MGVEAEKTINLLEPERSSELSAPALIVQLLPSSHSSILSHSFALLFSLKITRAVAKFAFREKPGIKNFLPKPEMDRGKNLLMPDLEPISKILAEAKFKGRSQLEAASGL